MEESLTSQNGSSRSNDSNFEDENYQNENQIINKFLLTVSLLLLVVSRTRSSDSNELSVPATFRRFPTVFFGSQMLLTVSFFSSLVGVMNSSSHPRRDKFSRFCAAYSCFCLGLMIISSSSVVFLPEFELPFWFTKQIYAAMVALTNPFPLFLALVFALPLLYQKI